MRSASNSSALENDLNKIRAQIIFLLGVSFPPIIAYSIVEYTVFRVDPFEYYIAKLIAMFAIGFIAEFVLLRNARQCFVKFEKNDGNMLYAVLLVLYVMVSIALIVASVELLPHAR